jgi:hypothetical protein
MQKIFISKCKKFMINIEEIFSIRPIYSHDNSYYAITSRNAANITAIPEHIAFELIDFINEKK